MSVASRVAHAAAVSTSDRVSALALRRYGHDLPVVVVNEYPKSGGTWLARMLATISGLPFLDRPALPPTGPAVLRTHWTPTARYEPCVYLVRDGRDVLISLFHHRCRNFDPTLRYYRALRRAMGGAPVAADIRDQLPAFVAFELGALPRGSGSRLPWQDHCRRWLDRVAGRGGRRLMLRYEDLLTDTGTAVAQACDVLLDATPAKDKIDLAVAFHQGQPAVPEAPWMGRSRFRVARAGQWRDVFTPAAGQAFAAHANDVLVDLGYETDRQWWRSLAGSA